MSRRKLCVVVPIYKEVLTDNECRCLYNLKSKIDDRDVFFVCAENFVADNYDKYGWKYVRFADEYFVNTDAYTRLLLTPHFYEMFIEYSYMLIHQTDAYLFGNLSDIDAMMDARYDYYGAPWQDGQEGYAISFKGMGIIRNLFSPRMCYVGNGGFSLRNIDKTVALLLEKKINRKIWNLGEDMFFAYHGQSNACGFRLAPRELASRFALEQDGYKEIAKGNMPIGVHAWERYCPWLFDEKTFDVPVVVVIFNRPAIAKKLYDVIRMIKPSKLLVISDSARENREGEREKVEECRTIFENIDWPCEPLYNYAEQNMGCDNRIKSGLDWVFDNVEQAIIFEDDCIPDISFFYFCKELLERYKNEPDVMYIAGSNQIKNYKIKNSYEYTYRPWTLGWATWRRAWRLDVPILDGVEEAASRVKRLPMLFNGEKRGIIRSLYTYAERGYYPWDMNWTLNLLFHNGYGIVPKCNLVDHIGFTEEATHVQKAFAGYDGKTVPLEFPLKHPEVMFPNQKYHKKAYCWLEQPLWKRMLTTDFYKRQIKKLIG